ncbi:MAG: 3-oxoacyl-ACP reductase FabG [Lachnospiraceae bacterium]|jgi:3-oxoacyl-[acyl-carrier protein] reductase|nr:3-oxoacyl-ACP reductase FabG [Lachnospiraceae bacterium]
MKTILITGASRGIGREIAINLAKEGYKVIANYNKSEKEALKLQKELQSEGFSIEIYKADVSKTEEIKQMVEYVLNKYKNIDVLINNAGISDTKLFTDITEEDWDKMINTNLKSAFFASQSVASNMIHNKNGCIINISSVYGMVGGACEVHYSVSKAGIDGLTKALAKELGPSNIRVNSIAPGAINTDMNKNLTKEDIEELKKETPLGRMGETKDIYKCVKWLIEDEYTTGQVISPNGGWVIV